MSKITLNIVKKRKTCCVQCAKCAEVCPVGLYPVLIKEAIEKGYLQRAKKLYLMDCIGCVLCTNACPCGIPLLEILQNAKKKMLNATEKGLTN